MRLYLTKYWAVSILLLTAHLSHAGTLYVDGTNGSDDGDGSAEAPFEEIGQAIAAAVSGDQIIVYSGRYGEKLTIDKNLQLTGYAGPQQTVIDAGFAFGPGVGAVNFSNNATGLVEGFSITGATNGIHFAAKGGSCNIQNCIIFGNSDHGIYVELTDRNTQINSTVDIRLLPEPIGLHTALARRGGSLRAGEHHHPRRRAGGL